MTEAVLAELARTFLSMLVCMGAVALLPVLAAVLVSWWPERRYRGRRRAGGRR